mmetsp:Transcript_1111/g.2464  ORF Transcript_1111/g.2464 Transcript_1111/m.2464 type:complete len:244 (+) Transcript_1111:6736-7467(+)
MVSRCRDACTPESSRQQKERETFPSQWLSNSRKRVVYFWSKEPCISITIAITSAFRRQCEGRPWSQAMSLKSGSRSPCCLTSLTALSSSTSASIKPSSPSCTCLCASRMRVSATLTMDLISVILRVFALSTPPISCSASSSPTTASKSIFISLYSSRIFSITTDTFSSSSMLRPTSTLANSSRRSAAGIDCFPASLKASISSLRLPRKLTSALTFSSCTRRILPTSLSKASSAVCASTINCLS